MNYSRGPWTLHVEEIKKFDHNTGEPILRRTEWIQNSDNANIALMCGEYTLTPEAVKANANVIAASPMMYDFIKAQAEKGNEDAKMFITSQLGSLT